jgi:hypothetical protein
MDEQRMTHYEWIEKGRIDEVAIIEGAIPENLRDGDFPLAVYNFASMAKLHADLGLLHWRRGIDPRADLQNAIESYEKMRDMARHQGFPNTVGGSLALVYAAMFLMQRKAAIEFEDNHGTARWPLYECCLVHALNDQELDARHATLLDKHLAENNALVDRIYLTNFQLLGLRATDKTTDELVREAEQHWLKRKTTKFFEDSDSRDGFGEMNDLYVDIYLAGVLKKIAWRGEGVHCWKWP